MVFYHVLELMKLFDGKLTYHNIQRYGRSLTFLILNNQLVLFVEIRMWSSPVPPETRSPNTAKAYMNVNH